jgi:hypothetical protein
VGSHLVLETRDGAFSGSSVLSTHTTCAGQGFPSPGSRSRLFFKYALLILSNSKQFCLLLQSGPIYLECINSRK